MRSALSLFWSWLFSSWHETTSPVGLCVMRTAESVVFTDCPPGPGRAEHVDLEVVRVDLDVDLLGLGQHRDRCRARVDAALALGRGDALHAVRPALVLEASPRLFALGRRTSRRGSRRDPTAGCSSTSSFRPWRSAKRWYMRNRSPAQRFASSPPSVPWISTIDVAALVRVARQQEVADLGREVVDARVLLGDLGLQVLPHLAVGLAVEQLAGVGDVAGRRLPLAIGVDERLQLGVPPAGVPATRGGRRTRRSRAGRTPAARARPRVLSSCSNTGRTVPGPGATRAARAQY